MDRILFDKSTFAHNLAERRKECGYSSQQAFAKAFNARFRNGDDLDGNNPTRGIYGTIKNYENPNHPGAPSLDIVLEMCSLLNCDIEHLLGGIKCKTRDNQFIHDEIGLSEASINLLRTEKQWGLGKDIVTVIDKLLLDCRFHNIDKASKRSYRPILNLLDYFFKYSNSGIRKQVYNNGIITDRGRDGFISSNAIELNDVVIENAVLAEIQLALISLKKSLKDTEDK